MNNTLFTTYYAAQLTKSSGKMQNILPLRRNLWACYASNPDNKMLCRANSRGMAMCKRHALWNIVLSLCPCVCTAQQMRHRYPYIEVLKTTWNTTTNQGDYPYHIGRTCHHSGGHLLLNITVLSSGSCALLNTNFYFSAMPPVDTAVTTKPIKPLGFG